MPGIHKIINGVIRFRQTVRQQLVTQFERIRDNPNPTAVFFTCMDSRMLPARITTSQVGDMFIVRNSGNMIPHAKNYGPAGFEVSVTTEPAALELAVKRGKIKHVIVCGHSDCKAINTLYNLHTCPGAFDPQSPMDHWLRRHGFHSLRRLEERLKAEKKTPLEFVVDNPLFSFSAIIDEEDKLNVEDKLSQINTLQQLENVASHGFLKEFLETHAVNLHAMWFDIYTGEMHMFSKGKKRFILIDESTVEELLGEIEKTTR
ncbi:unnamed protein product [Caenorhabditis auriculariae]|uniref:Carbonic anhydrase n=1 Tax=Caenorhabditis auriculariae TaxID=2777116 RepID=A0A8S1HU73_9PELO|nr:unnamed protein product [Caenorhabditis auriculariae]